MDHGALECIGDISAANIAYRLDASSLDSFGASYTVDVEQCLW
jgi:hypothetical protein